jgi:hypothetical protein
MQHQIGDVVNGHVLANTPNGPQWLKVGPQVSYAEATTLNVGRSNRIVFPDANVPVDPMKDKVAFTPQDAKPRKRRWVR